MMHVMMHAETCIRLQTEVASYVHGTPMWRRRQKKNNKKKKQMAQLGCACDVVS